MLDDWTWLNLLGGVAQIVGLLVAMSGVHRLKAEAFPDLSSPAATIARRVGKFVWHTVLRRPRRPVVVTGTASGSHTMSGSAFGYLPPVRPRGMYVSRRKILDYVDQVKAAEAKRREHEESRLHDLLDKLRDRIERHEQDTSQRLENQETRLAIALGGGEGRGLDTTWLGLVIAAAGLGAQGIAILLG